jgi:hypothetical protein
MELGSLMGVVMLKFNGAVKIQQAPFRLGLID